MINSQSRERKSLAFDLVTRRGDNTRDVEPLRADGHLPDQKCVQKKKGKKKERKRKQEEAKKEGKKKSRETIFHPTNHFGRATSLITQPILALDLVTRCYLSHQKWSMP